MWKVGQLPCILYILLQCCTILGQRDFTTPGTTTTTVNIEMLMEKKDKARHYVYNPNNGFEPYWADGEWLLYTSTTPSPPPNVTTTTTVAPPRICGAECNHLFQKIKHVCARQTARNWPPWNTCASLGRYPAYYYTWDKYMGCIGKPGDDYSFVFVTYNSYCEFLAEQCRLKYFQEGRLALAYVGPCEKSLWEAFPPSWSSWEPISRQTYWLASLHSAYTTPTTRG